MDVLYRQWQWIVRALPSSLSTHSHLVSFSLSHSIDHSSIQSNHLSLSVDRKAKWFVLCIRLYTHICTYYIDIYLHTHVFLLVLESDFFDENDVLVEVRRLNDLWLPEEEVEGGLGMKKIILVGKQPTGVIGTTVEEGGVLVSNLASWVLAAAVSRSLSLSSTS